MTPALFVGILLLGVSMSGKVLCPFSKGNQEFGYIQVSEENKYYYAALEAESDPKTAPTFLFFPGGFGSSGVAYALSRGPCILLPGSNKPGLNLYSWSRKANSIWIDAPGPTGFSLGPIEKDLGAFVENMKEFVKQFFKDHPNFNTRVHIVGESSAGSLAAMLGSAIVDNKELGIHLDGVWLGSSVMGPWSIYQGSLKMATDRKLLPPKEIEKMTIALKKCGEEIHACNTGHTPHDDLCEKATETCDDATLDPMDERKISIYDVRVKAGHESKNYMFPLGNPEIFFNKPEVQTQLGVDKQWHKNNEDVLDAFLKYTAYDTTSFVTHLLDKGLKVLVVHGEYDYITNAVGGLNWMVTLHGAQNYGKMLDESPSKTLGYEVSGKLGDMKSVEYANGAKLAFLQVTRGAHAYPNNRPIGIQKAFEAFLSGQLWQSGETESHLE